MESDRRLLWFYIDIFVVFLRISGLLFRFSALGAILELAKLLTEHSEDSLGALGAFAKHTLDGGEPGSPNKT